MYCFSFWYITLELALSTREWVEESQVDLVSHNWACRYTFMMLHTCEELLRFYYLGKGDQSVFESLDLMGLQ